MSKEETIQEALIDWTLAGGSLEDLVKQFEMFVEGLADIDNFQDGGDRQAALGRLEAGLGHVRWLAGKVDRAGLPERPPQAKPEPAPVPVLIEIADGVLVGVRASDAVQPSLWNHDEVREGLVPTALLDLPHRPVAVLREDPEQQDFPEVLLVRGQERRLLRVDGKVQYGRNGQPMYVSIPR